MTRFASGRASAVKTEDDTPEREMAPASPISPGAGYFEDSALPLTSLLFVIPMIILYEVGTRWYAVNPVSHVEQRIIAFSLMQQFFGWFGETGRYMPPLAVCSILMFWHLARGDSWTVNLTVLLRMPFECALYALPLIALGFVFAKYLPLAAPDGNWKTLFVLSIGAGVYEEMLFRLVAFTVLNFLLIDVLRMEKKRALLLILLSTGMAFSAYHYLGNERFEWRSFAFRTIAGIYFGLIFMGRGFGITAGSHAFYDIAIVAFRVFGPS